MGLLIDGAPSGKANLKTSGYCIASGGKLSAVSFQPVGKWFRHKDSWIYWMIPLPITADC